MKNLVIMVLLLGGAFALAKAFHADLHGAGCIALAVVFGFTALGHFAKPEEMQEMIPPWVPARKAMVLLSGFFELGLAFALVWPSTSRGAALVALGFLVLVTPLNVYSAFHRIRFGGHESGPRYLLLRLPLQALLIGWTAWFGLRLS